MSETERVAATEYRKIIKKESRLVPGELCLAVDTYACPRCDRSLGSMEHGETQHCVCGLQITLYGNSLELVGEPIEALTSDESAGEGVPMKHCLCGHGVLDHEDSPHAACTKCSCFELTWCRCSACRAARRLEGGEVVAWETECPKGHKHVATHKATKCEQCDRFYDHEFRQIWRPLYRRLEGGKVGGGG